MTYGKRLLYFAVIIGGISRFLWLNMVPPGIYWDEAAIGYDAYAIGVTGKDMHGNEWHQAIFPSYGDYKMPLYILFDVLFVKLMGNTMAAVRMPSVLVGLSMIGVVYLIGKELFSQKVAWYSAAFFALLPGDILFSRAGFEGHLAMLFIALTMLSWLYSIKKPVWLLVSVLPMTASVYSYFAARIIIPLSGIAFLIFYLNLTKRIWKGLFLLAFIIWSGLIIPIFNSKFYDQSNQYRFSTENLTNLAPFVLSANDYQQKLNYHWFSRLVYHRRVLQAKAVLAQVFTHLEPSYLFFTGDKNLRHGTGEAGVMLLLSLPILYLGLAVMGRLETRKWGFLMSLWIIFILPGALPAEVPHLLRSLPSLVVMALILGYGVNYLTKKLAPTRVKLIWVGLILNFVVFFHDYISHYPLRSQEAWQYGYAEAAVLLMRKTSSNDECVVYYPDHRLFLYYLYFNKIHPSEIEYEPNSFIPTKINQFIFTNQIGTKEKMEKCSIVDVNQWQQLGLPAKEIINDLSGMPKIIKLGD